MKYGENRIYIKDIVENNGFNDQPLMVLYHFNLGYQLLTDKSYLITPSKSITPRDDEANKGIDEYYTFQAPTAGYNEKVFCHLNLFYIYYY